MPSSLRGALRRAVESAADKGASMTSKCTWAPGLVLFLLAATASGGGTASIDIEAFTPNISGRGLFRTESADTHRQGEVGVGFMFHYAKNPFSLTRDRNGEFVSDRLTGNFLLSIGLTHWLELGAALPRSEEPR